MNCYCANYYGSIGCRNTVSKFGERCKLCVALKSGASMSNGLLDEDDLWMIPDHHQQHQHQHQQQGQGQKHQQYSSSSSGGGGGGQRGWSGGVGGTSGSGVGGGRFGRK
ncbi:hypothetical protein B0T18DRAFT_427544 [Schizothecium vesticola]|uniref:Uncharacterized protein n=1 Tax=Schizothecium vesticola TaxID=314040 RepID=A0AA40F1E9_9PEZI|nr:hypothetical protein B0T18DRAFT_427544 [Schizothecium vesticola]